MDAPSGHFTPVFQVSELNEAVSNHLGLLGEVTVEGEVSRVDIKSNRLIFVTIKDKGSSLDIFSLSHLVRNYRQFQPGMLVHVTGTAGLYKGSGKFRLMASSITPVGAGALQTAYEKLKNQLEVEGLFDKDRKRPLPEWPQRLGLITAKNSSAYFDVVKILAQRMSGLSILHLPVTVQGQSAVGTILPALHYCNEHVEQFDLLILCRGGGSLEDLQAFNDEAVARAVFASKVPIISAVGHEDDWSLTDYTADARASTPSNAAELAVRDRREVILELDSQLQFIKQQVSNQLNQHHHRLETSVSGLQVQMHRPRQQIDNLLHRFESQQAQLVHLLKQQQEHTQRLSLNFGSQANAWIHNKLNHLSQLTQLLNALDYQQVLKRGYSITFNQSGKVIQSISQTNVGQTITTKLSDGNITSAIQ